MKGEELQQQIERLNEQVRLLSEENAALTDRAEDMLLFGSITERLSTVEDPGEIIETALESLCSLKDLAYAAVITSDGDRIHVINDFSVTSGSLVSREFPLEGFVREMMLAKGTFVRIDTPEIPLPNFIQALRLDVSHAAAGHVSGYCLLPLAMHDAVVWLLCVSTMPNSLYLETLRPLLHRVIDFVEGRYESVNLLEEIRDLNYSLERKVRERTAELQRSIREKETLIREIHHRVKNNMQVIISLTRFQMRHIRDDIDRSIIQASQGRIQAMALVHEKLYDSGDFSNVNLCEYARGLIPVVFRSTDRASGDRIKITVTCSNVHIEVDNAVAVGLILYELMTNAVRHAFAEDDRGTIEITFEERSAQRIVMNVRDSGRGLPHGIDLTAPTTLGFELISILLGQINGTLSSRYDGGCTMSVEFARSMYTDRLQSAKGPEMIIR